MFVFFFFFLHMMLFYELEIKWTSGEPGVCRQNCARNTSAVGRLPPASAPATPAPAPDTAPAPRGRFGFLLCDFSF